eukprot:TRINITY_DN35778_c0_g1_i3.p1 TRINITY_DN35778_c0_g1~~TRINITY_DN35778_c0_g1_i3.p1  ORF type:complete len:227 (+),score=44.18 TRINITY_DN35778_c0_g1_i3:91-681(+)
MPKCPNAWNVAPCNRLVAERIEEHAHLRSKPKTRKLQEDRAAEIQLENRILLQKMLNIDTKLSPISGETLLQQRITPRSMNGEAHRRELDRITVSNQAMLRRLQAAQPSISAQAWYEEEVDREALKFRLSQNSCRGRVPKLRLPMERPSQNLPRIGGAASARFYDDDWAELNNQELDRHLKELESSRGRSMALQDA